LDDNDPLLSGIIDKDYIIFNHHTINKKVTHTEWDEFSEVDEEFQETTIPYDDNHILKWINEIKNKDDSLRDSIKTLIGDLKFVWNNKHYQQRSPMINESTFSHDILSPVLKFIAPKFFKRWDQAQSFSAKDRGVLKYVDVIGMSVNKNHLFENFFVEVSHGPFYEHPEQHIMEDNIKLGKLGKDSLDRNSLYVNDNIEDKIFLFHLHADFICVSLMDYKFPPVVRKISLDRIQIPFFSNDASFKMLTFIKELHKYRRIFEKFQRTYEGESNIREIKKQKVIEIKTHTSPKKTK